MSERSVAELTVIVGRAISTDLLALPAKHLSKGTWDTCDRLRRSRAVEQRMVAEEWSRRDQLASRGRARAASGASRSAGFEDAVQLQATRLAPIS